MDEMITNTLKQLKRLLRCSTANIEFHKERIIHYVKNSSHHYEKRIDSLKKKNHGDYKRYDASYNLELAFTKYHKKLLKLEEDYQKELIIRIKDEKKFLREFGLDEGE